MRVAKSASARRPIVVWNLTRTCNLHCVHCYTDSDAVRYDGELDTQQAKAVIDDLAAYNVPAILFSGGEPLVRRDLFDLIEYARGLDRHVVISTNGTLIDLEAARRFVELKLAYVGISLDSADPATHDRFRGQQGAFDRALRGIRRCKQVGQKVGLRLTLTRETIDNLDGVFDLIEREQIDRACFYHLCPSGRGAALDMPGHDVVRGAIDTIITRTRQLIESGRRAEILTVDNAADGVHLYLRMRAERHPRAEQVRQMLQWNGRARYSSGVGIANIDHQGHVHADQFSMYRSLGNVKQQAFSAIWSDAGNAELAGLRDRLPRLKGRCGRCRHQSMCGGGLRARAELTTDDPWASDPACYLTDDQVMPREAQVV